MAYERVNVLDDLSGLLHGTDTSKITNINSLLRRAAQEFLNHIDPAETKRVASLSLFDQILDYSPPSDLKGDKVIDIRPAIPETRSKKENFTKVSNEEFDLYGQDMVFTVEWDDATKFLRVRKALSGNILLHNMDSLTSNGTWAAVSGGGASNLAADEIEKSQGTASTRFDVGATGGAIENSTLTAIDLSDHQEKSSLFLRLFIPDSTIMTNVILRWGSDSSNYWSRTVTAPHIGSFRNGWQWVRFDWNGATQTGSVTETGIDYLRVTVTTTAADTDFRVDEIRSILPHPHEIVYYSNFLFRTSGGTFQETFSGVADLLNLEEQSYILYTYFAAWLVAQQIQGADSATDATFFERKLFGDARQPGLVSRYKIANPPEAIKGRSYYYRLR